MMKKKINKTQEVRVVQEENGSYSVLATARGYETMREAIHIKSEIEYGIDSGERELRK